MTDRPPIPLLPSERIRRFSARHIVHGKGQFAGEPFIPEGWERDMMVGIYDDLVPGVGGSQIRRKQEAVIGIAKKNGKTHVAAMLGAYGLYADGYYVWTGSSWAWRQEYGAEVYNVAGSKPQARVLFEIASGFVQRDPVLRSMSRVYKDAIEVAETDSVWRVLAADASLAHGPNPSTAIIDEMWVHKSPDLYEAFASAGAARRQPLLITIGTAGTNQTSVWWKLYERGQSATDRHLFFRWYGADDADDIDDHEAWRKANPSRWVKVGYLSRELQRAQKMGNEAHFRQFHLNQWVSEGEQAIPYALWASGNARPRIPEGADVVIGVDAAPKHDSTGIAAVHLDGNRVHQAKLQIMRADPSTGYLDFSVLEELLRELSRFYSVRRILVDPQYMIRSMLMLQDEGLPIEEFPQGDVRMVPASMNLYQLLVEGRLRHGGLAVMRGQIHSAAKRVTERGWRLSKRMSSGTIDGLIALAMACYVLEEVPEAEPKPVLFV